MFCQLKCKQLNSINLDSIYNEKCSSKIMKLLKVYFCWFRFGLVYRATSLIMLNL